MDTQNNDILLFDGVCNLCNRLVLFIIKRDPGARFKFAALQSDQARQRLEGLGVGKKDFDSIVLISNNRYYLKSSAALRVLKALGGIWRFFYIFIIIPVPVRDFVYDLLAKSRYRIFGRKAECMVPTPALRARFL